MITFLSSCSKEDLEKSLLRASREQGKINPGFRKGEIEVWTLVAQNVAILGHSSLCTLIFFLLQVTVLEDVIKGMKVRIFIYVIGASFLNAQANQIPCFFFFLFQREKCRCRKAHQSGMTSFLFLLDLTSQLILPMQTSE